MLRFTRFLLLCVTSAVVTFGEAAGSAFAADRPKARSNRSDDAPSNYVPPILPPAGHPRVLLRPADLERMQARLKDAAFRRFAERVVIISESGWDGTLPVPDRFDTKVNNWMEWGRGRLAPSAAQNYDPKLHEQIEFCALRFLLQKNEAMGERAISLLERVLRTITFPTKQEATDITRGKGATITTAAIVYDWCYPLLDARQKAFLIGEIRRLAAMTEVGFPPRGSAVVGHPGEANIFRDLTAAGIAVYDEDPEIYRATAWRLFTEMIPARNFFYPSHWHNQGSSYGHVRGKWELWCAALFDRMCGARVFVPDQAQLLYSNYYCLRPDGVELADGDGSSIPVGWHPFRPSATLETCELLSAHLSRDPVIDGMLRTHLRERDDISDTLPYFLFAAPDAPATPLAALPLSRYFGEPAGVLVARTGWTLGQTSHDVVASMKIAPWMFGNHQHLDAGHFQLWYRGMLATESGAYSGKEGGYGSAHWTNYYQRSIAHNTVLVIDPAEEVLWGTRRVEADGGQRWPLDGREPGTLAEMQTGGYHVGHVLAHAIEGDGKDPDYSYLCGSIQSYGAKVENFTRSFVFLNLRRPGRPAVLAVYDRVRSANPAFEKRWLLHTIDRPQIQPAGFSVRSQWGGRLDATVLLPASAEYTSTVVGGPGAEYVVNGTNYPCTPPNGGAFEGAGWRLELKTKVQRKPERFLVVMEVRDDTSNTSSLEVTPLQGEGWVGFRVADRAVLLPLSDGEIASPIHLELPRDAPTDVVLAGVTPGVWSANGGATCTASANGHVAAFKRLKGSVTLAPRR